MKILYLPNQCSQQRQREKARWIYPVRLAMEAEFYRRQGIKVIWHNYEGWQSDLSYKVNGILQRYNIIQVPENLPFLFLPHPDRIFTKAKEYTSGNYKYLPGTHMMVASGCWHGRCSFCVEQHQKWEVREVEDVIEELKECKALGFKEVFDDSGTFPIGGWLEKFCSTIIRSGFILYLGCNMRMVDVDYEYMRMVGFRMLLFGLESANQETLDRINKGVKVEDYKYIIKAAKAGLDCHVAVMFGYPWETDADALRTLRLVWELLRKGYAKTAQASFYTTNEPSNEAHRKYVKQIYRVSRSPEFWFNKLKEIKDKESLLYLWRQIKEGINGIK